MSDKHTPGPWRVKGATVWGKNGPLAVVPGPSQPQMNGSHIEPDKTRRLIAEAPEMLRQLIELTEHLERENRTDCDAYRDAMKVIFRVHNDEWEEPEA